MANPAPKSLTSDDVNYLIYRYLQESGFHHSAFTFAHESQVHRTDIDPNRVAAGALVTLIQKGLQYLEVEANLDDDQVDGAFQLLDPADLLTAEIDELRQLVLEKKAKAQEKADGGRSNRDADRGHRKRDRTDDAAHARQQQRAQEAGDQQQQHHHHQQQQQQQPGGRGKAAGKQAASRAGRDSSAEPAAADEPAAAPKAGGSRQGKPKIKEEAREAAQQQQQQQQQKQQQEQPPPGPVGDGGGGPVPMEEDGPAANGVGSAATTSVANQCDLPHVTVLRGHGGVVFQALWNPRRPLLVTGCSDRNARIWDFSPGSDPNQQCVVLAHEAVGEHSPKDVTTLDWQPEGTCVASGTDDGAVRVWDASGKLLRTMHKHTGATLHVKWNKEGDMLLTGSVDKTAIVWDAGSGEVLQVVSFHTAACLDGDWRDRTTFATCSSDGSIVVCKLGADAPLRTFTGHTDEVNTVRWDPSCRLLASCSDDHTAKVWSMGEEPQPLHDFREHSKPVLTARWSPTGPGTSNGHLPLLLATASGDATVKLWDVEAGRCYHTLQQQRHADTTIRSVSFSPDGRMMASGGEDKTVSIWDVASGKHVRSHVGPGEVLDVSWNGAGDRIAVSYITGAAHVLDVRMWEEHAAQQWR